MDEMIKQTIEALKANNIEAFYAKDTDVARDMVISMINKDDVIGAGGSMTLDQCNIRDEIRKSGYKFLDWFKADLSESEKVEILKNTLTCDVFLTGSNVITMDGKLFNVEPGLNYDYVKYDRHETPYAGCTDPIIMTSDNVTLAESQGAITRKDDRICWMSFRRNFSRRSRVCG